MVGAIACGLAAPSIARAADPFGTAQLVQEVNAAVTQATAAVPKAPAAGAVASVDSAKTLDAATKTLEVATKQAAVVASNAAAQAQRATQSVAVALVPIAGGHAAGPPAKAHRRAAGHRHRVAGRSSARQSPVTPRSTLLLGTKRDAAPLLASPSAAPAGRAQSRGSPASRSTSKPTRPSLPEGPPPLPLPPGPGTGLSGQAGGHAPLTPLLLGVLAGVLLMLVFEFLPRALPPKAFRKPRLIALTPWHPG